MSNNEDFKAAQELSEIAGAPVNSELPSIPLEDKEPPSVSAAQINRFIKWLDSKGEISDGYHTFNELYEHRCQLYITMLRVYDRLHEIRNPGRLQSPVWKSLTHSDGTQWQGWFILGLNTAPGKQITYHLPRSQWDQCDFAQIFMYAPYYDGHTADDVIERLKKLPL